MKHNKIKEHDLKVLDMLEKTYEKVAVVATPIDFHKRYARNDVEDPYASVIEWFYMMGAPLFGVPRE